MTFHHDERKDLWRMIWDIAGIFWEIRINRQNQPRQHHGFRIYNILKNKILKLPDIRVTRQIRFDMIETKFLREISPASSSRCPIDVKAV